MTAALAPHLSFRENARQAMEFYQSVFGGELAVTTWADIPMGGASEREGHLVLHSQLTVNDRMTLMASDSPASMPYNPGDTFTLSLSGGAGDDALLHAWWKQLTEGGTVVEPLVPAPWGATFGRVTDRFGTHWVFNITSAGN
jgi:PhnB protein